MNEHDQRPLSAGGMSGPYPPPAAATKRSGWATLAYVVRMVAGIGLTALLVLLVVDTADYVDTITRPRFGEPASAVQVTQVYAERIFYAIGIIGTGILVYIATRAAR